MAWISVEERVPNVRNGRFKVRVEDGKELDSFFYADKMGWIESYGQKTSYWWESSGEYERLDYVTHWLEPEENLVVS